MEVRRRMENSRILMNQSLDSFVTSSHLSLRMKLKASKKKLFRHSSKIKKKKRHTKETEL